MKEHELATLFKYDGTYRALIWASRQLELCGWCPKASAVKENGYSYDCDLARKDGVTGCHMCIAEHFTNKTTA
jgi:hypothetical protein